MAVQVVMGGDLANALHTVISPKLTEAGWTVDWQDDTLTEYIILMLANGKKQHEIAQELSTELLELPPEDPSVVNFATWLFEQVDILNNQINNPSASHQNDSSAPAAQDVQMDGVQSTLDSEMTGADAAKRPIPTGPKAMRNGTKPTSSRMFNQINRAMDRPVDSALHKIQGATGAGRINSHASRGMGMKGARGQQIQRNLDGAGRRIVQNAGMMGSPGFGFPQGPANPQQQAQFMRMFEEQALMMAQIVAQGGMMNPGLQQNPSFGGRPTHSGQNGKSLFNRVSRGRGNYRGNRGRHYVEQDGEDTAMADDGTFPNQTGEDAGEQNDPSQVMCKFNLYCTKPDCVFAHQSPAAAPGISVDLSSECTFGAACKNFKCVGRHPSPAKKTEHQNQQECKFGPFCANQKCPFKHSSPTPCRNGGDCAIPGCVFWHSPTECKFNPCAKVGCQFKHKEGQKSNSGSGNVWKAGDDKDHISERKFVDDENGHEEVIIPGVDANQDSSSDNKIVTE